MALNKLTFNVNTAGLGTPLASADHKSGIVYYNNTLPSGFSTSDRIKQIFSVAEAEALGIVEGTAAHAVEWYHINEFFQKQPSRGVSVYVRCDTQFSTLFHARLLKSYSLLS